MKFRENPNFPDEGLFWIIDGGVKGISSTVPPYDYCCELKGITHTNGWKEFRPDFPVGGKEVEFDYFPRGIVMIDPLYDENGKFEEYSCFVLLDKCISTDDYKKKIIDYFNLGLPSIPHIMWLASGKRTGVEFYQCHNCRKE